MKHRILLSATVALALSGPATLSASTGSADVKGAATSAVLAIDTGSSSRFDMGDLQRGLSRLVLGLPDADRASVCSFGHLLQCHPFTGDHMALLGEVSDLRDHDDARTFDSIDAAVKELREVNGRRVVILFTMAPDVRWAVSPRKVLADARAAEVTVYAIGLDVRYFDGDSFVDGSPDPEIQRLVRETGGEYIEVEHSDDLPAAFSHLAQDLR